MPFGAFKPRHVVLDEGSLIGTYRGLSGILPEPSYVGSTCAVILLVAYWVSFRLYLDQIHFSATCTTSDPCATISSNKAKTASVFFYSLYQSHFFSFISKNLTAVIMSIMAVILAFSPTSFIAYVFILSSLFIPAAMRVFCNLKLSSRMYLFLLLITCFFIALLLVSRFCSLTQAVSTINSLSESGLASIVSDLDDSASDRSASSVAGLFTVFYHPLGLGVNGHDFLFSDCSHSLINHFNLMCGSYYNSSRNHNAFGAFLQDGGIVGVLIFFVAFGSSLSVKFVKNFGYFSWVGRFNCLYLAFLFVVLPSPLGAPTAWIPLPLSCHLFVPLYFGSTDCCSNA